MEEVNAAECPIEGIFYLPACYGEKVSVGGLYWGRNECGTNVDLGNCPIQNGDRRLSIYRRTDCCNTENLFRVMSEQHLQMKNELQARHDQMIEYTNCSGQYTGIQILNASATSADYQTQLDSDCSLFFFQSSADTTGSRALSENKNGGITAPHWKLPQADPSIASMLYEAEEMDSTILATTQEIQKDVVDVKTTLGIWM